MQQQIHAQQIPGAPPQSIPSALGPLGPLGAFAGPMGLPHGPQSLLKNPQELHREDIKVPLAGPSVEERLVRKYNLPMFIALISDVSALQRSSVSPAEREKYRTRSPLDIESDTKRRKEDIKVNHVSLSLLELLNHKVANGK